MAISFKGAHFPQEIILMGVRWYVAYPLSYRYVEALLEERGVPVDHATIQRWVVKYSPQLEEARGVRAAGDPGAPAARRLPQGVRRNHTVGSSRAGAP